LKRWRLSVLLLLAPYPPVQAFELLMTMAERDGPAYLLRIEARFDAPPERLLAVMTDYGRLHELHPWLTESRSLGTVGPATEEVYTRLEGCILLHCRTLHRVEQIRRENGTLIATDVAGRSAFRAGESTWRLEPEGSGTRLQYESRLVPDFWVAPILGPNMLARTVERLAVQMMAEADRRAGGDHD
jgi:hypothetical protein